MKNLHNINFGDKKIIKKKKCVLCFSDKINTVLDFKKTPLANSYKKDLNDQENYFKLSCVLCANCGHLQLSHLANPKIIFEDYLYISGTSKVLKRHFIDYAKKIISRFKLNDQSKILDIACNDGTFLEYFIEKKFKYVVGVEPAKNLRKLNLEKKIDIKTKFFDFSYSIEMKSKYNTFDIITANNVFAHSPNLYDFSTGVKNLLSLKGVFIFEVSYLLTVIKKKTFDTIYHEHMSYHSLGPLINFFNKQNLQIFDFELIEAQGGSIRIYVSHKNAYKINKNKINKQIKKEKSEGLYSRRRYQKFFKEINDTRYKLKQLLDELRNKNLKIIGYGAPAKLTTLTHVFNLNKNDLKIVIDDNNFKVNKYTPGKNFLIKDFKYLENNKENYQVIIVLAWNFFESIKIKCKKINKKFLFISPFPQPRIGK